ncbi:WXG100 family type VII secretion target [Saccharopolyspora gloriosae]|uniref:WXG100 family type VII secretion target n=1 Tax=Saccharopolyspora gloriosae TaxID=455344 RepID=UPI001FB603D0|nr:WXG100 family type VII secretion target [Saccharopolyspora gloriosae]
MNPTASGGSAQPGYPPPPDLTPSPSSGQNVPGGANVASPGAGTPGAPPPVPDMEQTAAALATGVPESFYKAAHGFDGMAETFVNASERLRAQTSHLEQVWQGPAARGFTDAMREVNRTVDKLVETLNAPNYAAMLNQLGDALADAQRQVGQVKDQRQQGMDEFAASPAAADPAAQAAMQQQDITHNEQTAQVMQQLSNTYFNIGKRFGQFPEKSVRGTTVAADPAASQSGGGNDFGSGGNYVGSSGSGGSGGASLVLAPRTNAVSSYSSDQGVLGRPASTYGTTADSAEVYSPEVNEQGVVVPQSGTGESTVVSSAGSASSAIPYGLGTSGALRPSGNSTSTRSGNSSSGHGGSSAKSGQDGSGQEHSGSAESGQWSARAGEGGQPSTESTFTAPASPELSADQVEQRFLTATEGPPPPEGVEADLVPNTPQRPETDGAPLPEAETGSPTSGASAGSGGATPSASVPPVSTPSVSTPSVSTPSVPTPSATPDIPTGPPGSVAGSGATVPTSASATAPPASAPVTPGTTSPAAGGAGGNGMPMMPMGGAGAGMAGQLGRERFSTTLQQEDEETWDSSADITGGVLGR